jgi:membrane protein
MEMADGGLARIQSGVRTRWAALKERRPSVRHVVDAWGLMQRNNGNLYAGAITFFSFLALFPLLLLAVSVTGFVLHSHPALQQSLFAHVTDQLPGQLGRTIKSSLNAAIQNRTGLGALGLVGVLLTGLGWIGNLRAAIDAVWGRRPPQVNFIKAKLSNLVVLAGLGIGAAVSIGLTVAGTSLTDQILRAVGLDHLPGATLLLKIIGIAIAVLGDMAIFWWVVIQLPDVDVPRRISVKTALLASVGFEVLKIVGSYVIAHTANSPTAGPFAGIVAVLIWIQLVARWLLFACAWAATLTAEDRARQPRQVAVEKPARADAPVEPEIKPAAVGASLVAAGAIAGAAATWAVLRPGHGRGDRRGRPAA